MSVNRSEDVTVRLRVNGEVQELQVDARYLLADLLRDQLSLTGLHLGCEQGVCGACMVLIEGEPALSCLALAVEVDGCEIETIEHLSRPGSMVERIGKAFVEHCAFQCGFCTPGVLVIAQHILKEGLGGDREKIRERLSGNICRCTGYEPIIDAILSIGAEGTR